MSTIVEGRAALLGRFSTWTPRMLGISQVYAVEFLDAAELPSTATGKVQKFRLVELVAQNVSQGGKP